MAPPIRTNLDARMGFIRDALEEFIRPVKQAYMMAVDGLSIETEVDSKDVQKKRMKAQQRAGLSSLPVQPPSGSRFANHCVLSSRN